MGDVDISAWFELHKYWYQIVNRYLFQWRIIVIQTSELHKEISR